MKIDSVSVGKFVRRQTPDSRFTWLPYSWEELESTVLANAEKARAGYREGVVLVPIPCEGYLSPVVAITPDSRISSRVEARMPGEDPVVVTVVAGERPPAMYVEVVLYHSTILEGRPTSFSGWEIVAVLASPTDGPVPMDPTTMARNQLLKRGGTQGFYSSEEWAASAWFWATHASVE